LALDYLLPWRVKYVENSIWVTPVNRLMMRKR
jgi:hypothetical protein